MTGLVTSGEKRLVLVSGRAHMELAQQVGEELHCGVSPTTAYDFASGETYVRFNESVRGADVFVLQSHTGEVNKWLMEQLLMIDAAKRASAKRITAVAPYYPYARQDKKHLGREPISARLIADLFKTAGADRVMSVDLSNVCMVSPDAGRIRVAEKWSAKLGGCPLAFVHKTRDTTRPNVAVANRVVGDVAGKQCVLVDDMIDTAGTISEAVKVVMNAGASSVIVAATHGILSDPAAQRLSECGASEVIVTDTLPIAPEKRFDKLTVLPIAPLLARAIREVFDDGSVTSLFDGVA